MLLKLINFLRGNVRVEMKGDYTERLINMCAFNGIEFWDIKRTGNNVIEVTMRVDGFRRIRKYAKKTMTRVKIRKKAGVPFLVHRYRWRYALWGGAVAAVLLLLYLTSFIWTIEIVGCTYTTPAQIMKALNGLGLKTGVRKNKIIASELKNNMLSEVDMLSWIAINIKGTHAEVVVREREETPYMIPRGEPCDIVAEKTGVISKMNVKEGKALFKPGQTVLRGDILVTGVLDSETAGIRRVHSLAEVQARTWYKLYGRAPEKYIRKKYTGNKKKRLALIFGTTRVNLYLNSSIPFDFCDKMIEKEKIIINKSMYLPVSVVTETYTEYIPEKVRSVSGQISTEAKRTLLRRLSRIIQGGSVKTSSCKVDAKNGAVVVTLNAECLEEIALERGITEVP